MAMSKHQLADSLTKKTFTLEGKIKLLDANKERKQSCRQLVEMLNIGKTASANIIKNEASICKEYEEFNFHDGGRYPIETSPLICRANQWTGLYMTTASFMKELRAI